LAEDERIGVALDYSRAGDGSEGHRGGNECWEMHVGLVYTLGTDFTQKRLEIQPELGAGGGQRSHIYMYDSIKITQICGTARIVTSG